MSTLELSRFREINAIIERDSKDTTYKFALLRAVIDLSQEYAHLKQDRGDLVEFPLGLLIEKWLLYYYPLVDSPRFIPQKNGEGPDRHTITFREKLAVVTRFYSSRGGLWRLLPGLPGRHLPGRDRRPGPI